MSCTDPSFVPAWARPLLAAAAVAVGLLSAFVERGERAGIDGPAGPAPFTLALIGAVVVAWMIETLGEARGVRWPRPLFVGAVALPTAWFVFVGRNAAAPMLLVMLVGWLTYTGTRRQAGLALAAAALAIALPLPWAAGEALDWLGWGFGIASAWLSMSAVATQQRLLAQLRAAQADLGRHAADEERQRIAREMHDVVAHSLSITMLHLTGARHVLTRDPARAAEALAEAERSGRQSLADIRRTVGLLDAGRASADGPQTLAPLPGAADLADLVADFARAGLDVGLTVVGDPDRMPATAGLDLYRIAQEAIANVAKHAPSARTEVELTIAGHEARLRVRDDGRRGGATPIGSVGGSGLGLPGMRQRATLHGGACVAERSGEGWLVECVIPLPSNEPTGRAAARPAKGSA